MQLEPGRHANDEVLEQYSMGCLEVREAQALEEHLLICADCQDNLAFTDAYRKSVRSAALELRRLDRGQARPQTKKWSLRLLEVPKPVWILGMAAMALFIAAGSRWPSIQHSTMPPALVILESNRGAASPLNSSAPAAKPFTLMLDLTALPALPQYRLEIVDAAGRAVFGSTAAPEKHKLRATIGKGLPGGTYYVRVYGQELLREYGLRARD